MGGVSWSPNWIPHDDLLLRNAVEAGASLESLAKGAVQFSQRFALQELQDRWYSLLYDPNVAEEASVHMVAFEQSGLTYQLRLSKSESMNEITSSPVKRKAESIRRCYYVMRKRICKESFDMINLDLLPEPDDTNFSFGNEPVSNPVLYSSTINGPAYDSIRHDSNSEFATCATESANCVLTDLYDGQCNPEGHVGVLGFDQSAGLPLFSLVEADSLQSTENPMQELEGIQCHNFFGSSSMPQMPIWDAGAEGQNTGDAYLLPETDTANGSDDLLEKLTDLLFDEDELLFMDPDGNDSIGKSYIENFSSVLLDTSNETEQPEIIFEVEERDFVSFPGGPDDEVLHLIEPNKVPKNPSPALTMKGFGPEYRNGKIDCKLNTEDPEIPSNDDVFLLRFPSLTFCPAANWELNETNYLSPSCDKKLPSIQKTEGPPPVVKKNQKASSKPSEKISKYPAEENKIKFELPKSDIHHMGPRYGIESECPTNISSANVNMNRFIEKKTESGNIVDYKSSDAFLDKQACLTEISQDCQNNVSESITKFDDKGVVPNITLSSAVLKEQPLDPNPINVHILSDQEELWSENDFDVPYFSDVEAMILDMDLMPDEYDVFSHPEVQQYQDENTKRTIIRLEQAVNACTQRAIVLQGAFAVLYGRRSKHFINKPEVVIGRATEDVQVDIDLGGEKNGGKISRRQASIKMGAYGSFHLNNLGKCLIYVNDKTIARGESLSLPSGCLIEIRGVMFLFEAGVTQ